MTILNHILGFPRIGIKRELKKALESYWAKKINKKELLEVGYKLKINNWNQQKNSGINFITVGDFAWYDHVLTTSMMLGNIPERYITNKKNIDIDTMFDISRGKQIKLKNNKILNIHPSAMKKWFNTNYHYIVPEFTQTKNFSLSWLQIIEEIDEAISLGFKNIKPVLLGPITYLWLGKEKNKNFDKLSLLDKILPLYKEILEKISKRKISWVQIDEPILTMELPYEWLKAFRNAYNFLKNSMKIMLTTYFGDIQHNLKEIINLPIEGIHIDLINGKYEENFFKNIPKKWIISLGIINGKNIWRANLNKWFKFIKKIKKNHSNIWIASSCSLLHCPIDVKLEKKYLTKEIYDWFSFALQKCEEISLLTEALNNNNQSDINNWVEPILLRKMSHIVHNNQVLDRISQFNFENKRSTYKIRKKIQSDKFNLPLLPTTTIGSFPQTTNIRKIRMDLKNKKIDIKEYNKKIAQNIQETISIQEKLNLDVLVHGEPERNDMVEYFGENLEGFIFTYNGWVQSYGSRCVKPPIIIGDIYRSKPITVKWSKYSQSLTKKLVKGILTGPMTIFLWSFPREDLSKKIIVKQLSLAIRDEVKDLENAGIKIIQIDEPALREGLPLRQSKWENYLNWAISSFHIVSSVAKDDTQIHTHMCYSEFNDIIQSIASLDADVITIETSRSNMELLKIFKEFKYPNDIGPGVYDIHSTNIPDVEDIKNMILKAKNYIPIENLWVNPDCGLKTRSWIETKKSLTNMMLAVKQLRNKYKK